MSITIILIAICCFGLVLGVYYLGSVARRPEVICSSSPLNSWVLEFVDQLQKRFWVTPWAFNTHLQLLVLGLRKAFSPGITYERTDTLVAPDGGVIALQWIGESLPAKTPILVLLHTITGSPHSMRVMVPEIHQRTGWRVVLCQRRAHGGLPVTSPRINTMGCVEDLRIQIKCIQSRFPEATLYACGVSAGTGLLVRYLGEEGDQSAFKAAFVYSPGYDLRLAFGRSRPFYSRLMARKLKRNFLIPNRSQFSHLPTFQSLLDAKDLDSFHKNIYECAGYASWEEYLQATNPIDMLDRIAIPMMILNAADDPVCVEANVRENQRRIQSIKNCILVVTNRGSHYAHFEGLGANSWSNRLISSYLMSVHEFLSKENSFIDGCIEAP